MVVKRAVEGLQKWLQKGMKKELQKGSKYFIYRLNRVLCVKARRPIMWLRLSRGQCTLFPVNYCQLVIINYSQLVIVNHCQLLSIIPCQLSVNDESEKATQFSHTNTLRTRKGDKTYSSQRNVNMIKDEFFTWIQYNHKSYATGLFACNW